jgi:methionyl-tRNA synthetase
MGYDTLFLTGADEHGQKIEQKAKEQNLTPQKYVDLMSSKFVEL